MTSGYSIPAIAFAASSPVAAPAAALFPEVLQPRHQYRMCDGVDRRITLRLFQQVRQLGGRGPRQCTGDITARQPLKRRRCRLPVYKRGNGNFS
nr:hypothetical protein [Enterobacter hormaechei]